MKCPNCGSDLADGVLFCRECGERIYGANKRFCRECGSVLKPNAKFCSECGAKTEITSFLSEDTEVSDHDVNEVSVASVRDESENREEYVEPSVINERKTASKSNNSVVEKTNSAKKRKPAPPKKKSSGKLLIVVIAFVIAVGGICYMGRSSSAKSVSRSTQPALTSEPKIAMVNVVNMAYPAALNLLQTAGFTNITSNIDANTDESLWVVTEQSVGVGKTIKAGDKIVLTCARRCNLYVDVRSESNLLFSTYDISITLDGIEIGTVANGKGFTSLREVVAGEHTLLFCKSGSSSPKTTKKFLVKDDMTFSCELAHSGSSIEIKNESRIDNIGGASLEVINVTGMVLSDAFSALEGIGFSNIREEPYGSIWNRNNWIVMKQGLPVGSNVDKNEFFQLDCISLDDYFSQAFVGKNVNDVQALARESGFSIRFESASYDDLNNRVASMSKEQKNEWIVKKARQYGGADKTAVVTINNPSEVSYTPTPSRTPSPTKAPTQSEVSSASSTNNTVSYSTNDKSTVKSGNKGIYSYRNRGSSYYVYYIIDFDEGYVYRFLDGNGDNTCEKVRIESGNLNDVLIITYNDNGYKYSNGLHFKWKNQPDHLILQDEDGFEWDFYTTDLDDALKIRNSKKIYEY